MLRTKKETSDATLAPKKRGRPAGSKNKPKATPVKRGRPVGSHNKTKAVAQKPKVVPSVPTPPITLDVPVPKTSKRGRPIGAKNIPQPDVPKVAYTLEPIRGFMEIMQKFGDKGYMVYQVSATSMELQAEDMPKAVQKYMDSFGKLPTRVILHERNEKLLPYLNAEVPDVTVGLVTGGTSLWEMRLQVPN